MKPTVYRYINQLGRLKELWVDNEPDENEKFACILWDMRTGECCGTGNMKIIEIKEMLANMKNVEKIS